MVVSVRNKDGDADEHFLRICVGNYVILLHNLFIL